VEAVKTCVPSHGRVAILGLSYKPQTHVIEESQGVMLAAILAKAGYTITAHDPMANGAAQAVLQDAAMITDSVEEAVNSSDAVVFMTPWPEFRTALSGIGSMGFRGVLIDPWGIATSTQAVRVLRLGTGDWLTDHAAREEVVEQEGAGA
jgi:UDPglucose 6-dehydrogenase